MQAVDWMKHTVTTLEACHCMHSISASTIPLNMGLICMHLLALRKKPQQVNLKESAVSE